MTGEDKTSDSNNSLRVPEILPVNIKLTDNKLNGSNYFKWSKTIRIYLRIMGMASHLTSDPPKGNETDSWFQSDARLYLQIINTIESSVSSLVSHCEYVKELMNYLYFLYSGQSNISRIYSVCKSFHRGEQQNRSLTTYVMEFKKVYEELYSLLPLSDDVKVMQTQREQVVVISFLTDLRPEFDSIRSRFLNESTIPSLQETFVLVLRNENLQASQTSDHNSVWLVEGDFVGVTVVSLKVATVTEQLTHGLLFQILIMLSLTTAMS
ncbi:uncharacterized protein LOC112502313 [Cynara cardunculus var. scolymus]|uniref:uncharacterized protein LOC112502313 n=1 Tax=Cynara cardunculus var. scolymus TaxID=59895 RepID=UPI000D62BB82|nr:uncharacterized protein LOC112502313 [Cynara cardunculus var. scolymus]